MAPILPNMLMVTKLPSQTERSPEVRERVPDQTKTSSRLLVIGGGMAGFGLCDRLVKSETSKDFSISIIGEEPTPAYDRVNLSKLFQPNGDADQESERCLDLADAQWYRDHQIDLVTGRRISSIDREKKRVTDQNGNEYPYDQLVLATGSRARVPPIKGADQTGVFVYRTVEDLRAIRSYVEENSAAVGAVIGGGLLGLEAARLLQDFGLQTSVIEMAPGLMPRQLDADGAAILKDRVEAQGVSVHLVRRMESIEPYQGNRLALNFSNAKPMYADIIIIAAGVIPNDELGKEAGLKIGPRGGIVIDETLQTSDPDIFAIGECACFEEHVFGLVAPCYRMADVLASRFAGTTETFEGADESAELKLMGVQVAVLGLAIGESPDGVTLTHRDERGYRKLLISQGKVVGAACVGEWDELPQMRQAVHDQVRLWPWQQRRFRKHGSPWTPGGTMPVIDWPGQSIVCSCLAITKSAIASVVADGVTDPDQIAETTGASTACGSCRSLVCELAGGPAAKVKVPAAKTMMAASIAAVVFSLAWLFIPPIPFAESVQSSWRDVDYLWRDDFPRQVTGFTLLGLLVIGLVFSLRKRTTWFKFGSYGLWRAVHAVLGTAVLVALAVHTGFRVGENQNFVLAMVFIATAALGSIAGILSSLESKLSGHIAMSVRRYRPILTKLHLLLFWPLPILIAVHIFSFYWFSD